MDSDGFRWILMTSAGCSLLRLSIFLDPSSESMASCMAARRKPAECRRTGWALLILKVSVGRTYIQTETTRFKARPARTLGDVTNLSLCGRISQQFQQRPNEIPAQHRPRHRAIFWAGDYLQGPLCLSNGCFCLYCIPGFHGC